MLPLSHTVITVPVEIHDRIAQANLTLEESGMDITILTRVGLLGVVFVVVVGVGVDGMVMTMIASKIGIGILHHAKDVAVPEARKDSMDIGHDRIVRLKDL